MIIDWDHFGQNEYIYHVGYSSDKVYQEFYNWMQRKKLKHQYTDMPHHFFVFENEIDRLVMESIFSQYLNKTDYSDFEF
jgi:hypothetical protein